MPFKIKDLLIDIAAAEAIPACPLVTCKPVTPCLAPTIPCKPVSPCPLKTCKLGTGCALATCKLNTCKLPTYCKPYTPCGAFSPCGIQSIPCGMASPGCGGYSYEQDPWTPIEEGDIGELMPEDLGGLKQRLEQALEVVNARQAEIDAAVVREPTTHEEIDALEGKLEEALKDLRDRREKLRGGNR